MIQRALMIAGVLLGLAAFAPRTVVAQGITRAQADSILAELKQIHQLLEKNLRQQSAPAAPAPAPDRRVTVPAVDAYELGRPDAPLTLLEFTDYECTFCRRFHISTFELLKKDYIDTGKLRFMSFDLPLDFHRLAFGAANAARCAGEQGKYWDLRHVLIVNADRLDTEALLTYAKELNLDMPLFQACLESEKYGPAIRQDVAHAQAVGISATPSFVLGATSKQSMEGVVIVGAQPYGNFEAKIRELLSQREHGNRGEDGGSGAR